MLEQDANWNSHLGYTGELTDDNGLVYLRARYYNPGTGQFLTSDPIEGKPGNPTSFNKYGYALGNPVRYTDPSGKAPPCILCIDTEKGGSIEGGGGGIALFEKLGESLGRLLQRIFYGETAAYADIAVGQGIAVIQSSDTSITMNADNQAADDSTITPKEQVDQQVKDLTDSATLEDQKKGIYSRDGGLAQAEKEFDALNPTDVDVIEDKVGNYRGRRGVLADGTKVNVRTYSSDGRPTLEFDRPSGSKNVKFRYD